MNKKKFSIIIPVYNGMPYLKSCINTILMQTYEDFELIVSDDHSTDGSTEYLKTLSDPRLRVIFPENEMSMTEHWEWALSHAEGEWQLFVGQDDGLQMYFFELADYLTSLASSKGFRSIVCKRAYYFWPGCESFHGPWKVKYSACNKISVRSCWQDALSALLGGSYHNLPQMYTSSLFKRELLNEARERQSGRVFCCHPQDANLAAVSCTLDKNYLRSEVPIGWVGSSIKSAGLAISAQTAKEYNQASDLKGLASDYIKKVDNSDFEYNSLAGDFSLGSTPIYFWQALLQTNRLRSPWINRILRSKIFRLFLFSSVLAKDGMWDCSQSRKELFVELLHINQMNFTLVIIMARWLRLMKPFLKIVKFVFIRVPSRIRRLLVCNCYDYRVEHASVHTPDIVEASMIVSSEVRRNKVL